MNKSLKNTQIHPRNKHKGNYSFEELVEVLPELKVFVKQNNYKNLSIDFFNPLAVNDLELTDFSESVALNLDSLNPNVDQLFLQFKL